MRFSTAIQYNLSQAALAFKAVWFGPISLASLALSHRPKPDLICFALVLNEDSNEALLHSQES